jgi:hypothetical protein
MNLNFSIDRKLFLLVVSAAIALIGSLLQANADPIYVPNASFETSEPAQTSTNPNIAPGWVFTLQGDSAYGIGSISSDFSSPGTSSGTNYAFINNVDDSSLTDTITSAASLGEVTSDTTYTLTVAVGNTTNTDLGNDAGDFYFGLTADGNPFVIDPISNSSIPDGTFQDFTFSFTTDDDLAWAGESLGIVLGSASDSTNSIQTSFDNVRLDEVDLSAVSEPKTGVLVVLAGCALYLLRRNQRTRETAAGFKSDALLTLG